MSDGGQKLERLVPAGYGLAELIMTGMECLIFIDVQKETKNHT